MDTAWSAEAWAAAQPAELPEVLLVLAGGVGDDGIVHESVARRLDAAAALFKRSGGALSVICNGGGTAHKPRFLDAAGFAVPEAVIMATALKQRGVPLSSVFLEGWSDDTLGNAFAARTMHTDLRPDWRRVWVLTSDFQLPRARAVYNWVYGLSPQPAGPRYELTFVGTPDEGEEAALAARRTREASSLASFSAGVGKNITTLAACHSWLFSEHGAYKPPSAAREPIDPSILKTY